MPRKNLKLLAGKPLICHSIEHALAAKEVNRVVVSTDDQEIERVAKQAGAEVLRRPAELANDTAKTIDVIRHCLKSIPEQADYLVLLQPTVPFRDPSKIDQAVRLIKDAGCDSVVSMIRVDYFHPNRMKRIAAGRLIPYCEKEIENVPRDFLPPAYYRDGSIYAMRAALPFSGDSILGEDSRAVINDSSFFVNIDNERDWLIAEILAKGRISSPNI